MNTLKINLLLLVASLTLVFPPALTAEDYKVRVLQQKPISRELFTQGLEFDGNDLLISSGLYKKSKLQRMNFATLDVTREQANAPGIFAEGLTVLDDRIYQLTWQNKLMLVHDRMSFNKVDSWPIAGEGWGLTHNGKELIYSDGSHQLTFVNPSDGALLRTLDVTFHGAPVRRLNELEWVEGRIWANIWGSDFLAIIDPETGIVTDRVDLKGLLPRSDRRRDTDVLNGIARHPGTGAIWVTGKRWPWIYQIEVILEEPAKIASPIAPPEQVSR
jgi:glutamine cyclotransferase